jgi:hypothetical protein
MLLRLRLSRRQIIIPRKRIQRWMKIYGSVEVTREIELSTAYGKKKYKKLKKCNKITTLGINCGHSYFMLFSKVCNASTKNRNITQFKRSPFFRLKELMCPYPITVSYCCSEPVRNFISDCLPLICWGKCITQQEFWAVWGGGSIRNITFHRRIWGKKGKVVPELN